MKPARTVAHIIALMVANADTGAAGGCYCCKERLRDLEALRRAIEREHGKRS